MRRHNSSNNMNVQSRRPQWMPSSSSSLAGSLLLLCLLSIVTTSSNAWSFRSHSGSGNGGGLAKVQPKPWKSSTPSSSSTTSAATTSTSTSATKKPTSNTAKAAASDAAIRGGFSASDDGDDSDLPLARATIPNEVFNLIKSIVGAGVLSLPAGVAAFANAPSALIPATLLIVLMGSISAYTFGLIGRVCRESNTSSYSDAWNVVVGQRWAPLIAFSCLVDCFAGNLSYSMILADTMKLLLAGVGFTVTRTQSLLGVTGLVLLPLCLLKNLNSLAPFSLVGIMGMVYTIGAMALRYFGGDYVLGQGQFVTDAAASSLMALPKFGADGASALWTSPKVLILMCMLSNAYIAHFNAPKFLNELDNPTLPRFYQVIGWSFGGSMLIFATLTALGFATFGAASNGLILNNYAPTDAFMNLSRIAVAVSITCSYPLIFVGARDGLLDLLQVKQRNTSVLNKTTFGLIAIVTALASQLTNLGLVASVGGATFGTALVFVYPVIMFRRQQQEKSSDNKKTPEFKLAGAIGLLGIIMGAIGTVLSFQGAEV